MKLQQNYKRQGYTRDSVLTRKEKGKRKSAEHNPEFCEERRAFLPDGAWKKAVAGNLPLRKYRLTATTRDQAGDPGWEFKKGEDAQADGCSLFSRCTCLVLVISGVITI